VQDSLTQAVMQGIGHIGVVTGQLRSGGEKRDLNQQRTQQILSLLESAASSLKSSPEMSESDKIVSNIVEAAHELVRSRRLLQYCTLTLHHLQMGTMMTILSNPVPSPASACAPAVDVDEVLQSQAARHSAAVKARCTLSSTFHFRPHYFAAVSHVSAHCCN
jgi:hypothetical protein